MSRIATASEPRPASEECPVSYVTGESLAYVEAFFAWRALGGGDPLQWPAKKADAFRLLDVELKKVERSRNGERV